VVAQLAQRVTPMRRTNLVRLRAFGDEAHFNLPIGAGEGTLILPGAELKNLRSIHVTIDPETVRMLNRFIEVYRPLFVECSNTDPENPHLFPGAESERKERGENGGYPEGFGYMIKGKLCQRFRKHIRRHSMLHMDLQVMRHIAGKVILDMDPSAMGLVQEVLGHKRIETTQSYYAQVSKIVAQKNYLQLLDQYSRRVMSHVDFRIGLEQQLEG
jgi:integrase